MAYSLHYEFHLHIVINCRNMLGKKSLVEEYIWYDFMYIKFKTCKTKQYIIKNKTCGDPIKKREGMITTKFKMEEQEEGDQEGAHSKVMVMNISAVSENCLPFSVQLCCKNEKGNSIRPIFGFGFFFLLYK